MTCGSLMGHGGSGSYLAAYHLGGKGGRGGNRTTNLASKGNMKSQPRPALSTTLPSEIIT